MTYTVVSFHAHPDDEALLTGGTLAMAAAGGHRVVLVVATAGEAGLTSGPVRAAGSLGRTRLAELEVSARALGCAGVEFLGYADSGFDGGAGMPANTGRADTPDRPVATDAVRPFAHADVDEAASRLAELLRRERADVLTVYDPLGGYGHADHVQVHRVGVRAAELAGTPVVLEATVDRDALRRAARVLRRLPRLPIGFSGTAFEAIYSPRRVITHRVAVGRFCRAKRTAMAAHVTQTTADTGFRAISAFTKLPLPLFRLVFGREWFIERGRLPTGKPLDDIFSSLRDDAARDDDEISGSTRGGP